MAIHFDRIIMPKITGTFFDQNGIQNINVRHDILPSSACLGKFCKIFYDAYVTLIRNGRVLDFIFHESIVSVICLIGKNYQRFGRNNYNKISDVNKQSVLRSLKHD